jgi:arsenate reductase (thioredoxin)
VQNSARSQMAEALTRSLCGPSVQAFSAGLEPGTLNPLAVEALAEEGIDISRNETKSVFDLYRSGALFNYVVTVCDEASAERCPVFPGFAQRLHWSLPDPAAVAGSREDRLAKMRAVRDELRDRIKELCRKLSCSIA